MGQVVLTMAPKFNHSNESGGMFDNLKSRLGFGEGDDAGSRSRRRGSRNDDYVDDYDDDYVDDGEFGEYGDYADDYEDEFGEYGPEYDDGGASNYRPTIREDARRRSNAFETTSNARGAYRNSNLVTIDDVKAHTQIPDRLKRDPLPPRQNSGVGRSTLSESVPSVAPRQTRSEGLDSLFTPTVPENEAAPRSASAYDPYEAYESSAPSSHVPARSISVLKPVSYGDVERIAKALKSGDVVVIALRNTPDDLSKRILDFSFGVASALDAAVECPGEKVFAITRGQALSEAEKQALRNQGVL